ncbi:MAG: leucyl aminopeptidase family protein [Actinomycetales bacterium]
MAAAASGASRPVASGASRPARVATVPHVSPADLLVQRRPPNVRLVTGPQATSSAATSPAAAAAAGSQTAAPDGARVLVVLTSASEGGVSVSAVATAALADLCGWSPEDLRAELERAGHRGEAASVSELHLPAATEATVLAVGLGAGSPRELRRAGAVCGRRLRGDSPTSVIVLGLPAVAHDSPGASAAALVEGALLGAYQPVRLRAADGSRGTSIRALPGSELVLQLDLVAGQGRPGRAAERARQEVDEAVDRARTVARATWRARDLANLPSSVKGPTWVAEAAALLAQESGLQLRIRGTDELQAEGFGGILAVGRGSAREPRLVELTYAPDPEQAPARGGRGSRRRSRHVVLVGKGITFDTGGLSLKRPWDAMVAMKTDMAAAGAVLAVMAALPALGARDRVTGLLALAENMPGADAARPGDVIVHYGGRTSEVLNTDAEGRLVLADALAYADAELDPDVVVDLATLTGAATLGLGRRHAPMYTTDAVLAQQLEAASAASGDQVWAMPLVEDYRAALDSDVADIANVSRDPSVMGGSITAALFLREFAGRRPWAHLDIAGTGRADGDEHEISKGATGFGVRLLCEWLRGSSA